MTLILIAEDNDMNRELLMTVLSHNGYDALAASDGLEAFEITKSRIPDLVLMDIQMPNVDGFDALYKIRESKTIASTPIVAVTGNVMPHDLDKIRSSGFDAIVFKPYKIDELLETISRLLSTKILPHKC